MSDHGKKMSSRMFNWYNKFKNWCSPGGMVHYQRHKEVKSICRSYGFWDIGIGNSLFEFWQLLSLFYAKMPLWTFQRKTEFLFFLVDDIKIIKYHLQHGTMYNICNNTVCLNYTISTPPPLNFFFWPKMPLVGYLGVTLMAKVFITLNLWLFLQLSIIIKLETRNNMCQKS